MIKNDALFYSLLTECSFSTETTSEPTFENGEKVFVVCTKWREKKRWKTFEYDDECKYD